MCDAIWGVQTKRREGGLNEPTNALHHTRQSKLPHCKHPLENGIRFVANEDKTKRRGSSTELPQLLTIG
jgi:hypothetical protein